DGLQDLLAASLRVVVEALEREHPVAQVHEVDAERIHVGVLVGERDRDLARIGPLHRLPSATWLMVYLGISTVRSSSPTFAWQERREVSSRPQALSSRSSSFSLAGSRESKPSRTITWQVVQAQLFSHACSIS